MGAQFRILGPFEVLERGQPLVLGGTRQRALLAVLLLHRGQTISTDRLVDALWGECPPASATKTVQVYVSRLRKVLGDGMLETHGHAYRLIAAPSQVDADRFEALVADGRQALQEGDARLATGLLSDGLNLWRGPPLADFAHEAFAQDEIERLQETRLAALEDRIDANLRLGRHTESIAELEVLVREHPLRERLCELLMLALYRAGRQADALEMYRAAHDHLKAELGIEPGPALRDLQGRILRHDPALNAGPAATGLGTQRTSSATALPRAGRRDTSRRRIGAGLAVVVVLAVAAILNNRTSVAHVDHAAMTRILQGPAVGVFNVIGGQARAAVSLSAVPTRLAAGLGAAWATSYDDGTLLRIDTGHQAVTQTIRAGDGATGVAVYAGDVWVADSLSDRVARVDGGADQVVQRISVGDAPVAVAGGFGAVWVVSSGAGTVTRINPSSGAVVGVTRVGPHPSSIAAGAEGVWVALEGTDQVVRLDPRTGRAVATITVGSGPSAVAALGNRVWVANRLDSTVSLIDAANDRVVLTHPVAGAPEALAATGNAVWASGDSRVLSNVTAAGRFHTIPVPSPATALTIDAGQLLVGVSGSVADHRGGTLTARLAGPISQIDPGTCCDLPPDVRMLSWCSGPTGSPGTCRGT